MSLLWRSLGIAVSHDDGRHRQPLWGVKGGKAVTIMERSSSEDGGFGGKIRGNSFGISLSSFDLVFWSRWSAGVGRTGRFWRGGRRTSTVCASWKKVHPATEQRIPSFWILKVMEANKPNTFWSLNTLESNVLMSILCVLSFCGVLHVEVVYNVVIRSRLADKSCKVILLG